MTVFWSRLIQINARKVMWTVLPACQVILLFCLWRVAQTDTGVPMIDVPPLPSESYAVTNGFPRLLQMNQAEKDAGDNPFNSLYMESLLQELQRVAREKTLQVEAEAEQQARDAAALAAAAAAATTDPVPTPEQPAAPEPTPAAVLQLTYRGMMMRPDGTRLALIEAGKDQPAAFFPAGSLIAGRVLRSIERHGASLIESPDAHIALELGMSIEVEVR